MKWFQAWFLLILPKTFRVLAPLFVGMALALLLTLGCISLARSAGFSAILVQIIGFSVFFIAMVVYELVTEVVSIEKANFSVEEMRNSPVDVSSPKFGWLYRVTLLTVGLSLFALILLLSPLTSVFNI